MIEEAQKVTAREPESISRSKEILFPWLKPRKLPAIEIAEGALLADIGVIFQLIGIYLPIGKSIFHLFTFVVFAVIALRRGLYVGSMSLCVALFIVGVTVGPHFLFAMLLQGMGGLFLGLTMRHRLNHFLLLFLGVTGGTLTLYGLILLLDLLTGIPLITLVLYLQESYNAFIALMGHIMPAIGLGYWWNHSLYPFITPIANIALTYWPIFYGVLIWIGLWPIVIALYYITNLFVRMMGYNVRPFPSGVLEKLLYWILHQLIKLIPKKGIGKYWITQTIIKEVRRLGIARYRTKS